MRYHCLAKAISASGCAALKDDVWQNSLARAMNMVGLVPHLLEKLILTSAGAETLAEVRRRAGIPPERNFAINGYYSDEEWRHMFESACDALGLTNEEAEDAYADFFFRDALIRWPRWFAMSANSREFLQRQPAIHNTFAMSQADPDTRRTILDKFEIEIKDNELVAHYRSPNHHCGLYKSLARRIIGYYGDTASIESARCMKRGATECAIHIRWDNV